MALCFQIRKAAASVALLVLRCYWHALKPRTRGSRVVLTHGENVLLTKNLGGTYWALPGGGAKKGESPLSCLLRELYEELRIQDVEVVREVGQYLSKKEGKQDLVHVFFARVHTPTFEAQWELEDARWFPLASLPQTTSPATLRRIRECVEGQTVREGMW